MARIQFGPLVSDVRGKLGDVVFSRNQHCPYVRWKGYPGNDPSVYREYFRTLVSNARAAWRTLSTDQYNLWKFYSENLHRKNTVGISYHSSTYLAFMRTNFYRQYVGNTITLIPPLYETPEQINGFVIVGISDEEFQLYFGVNNLSNNFKWIIFATPNVPQGINYPRQLLKFVCVINPVNDDAYDITGPWSQRFNSFPQSGSKIFVQVYPVHLLSGVRSITVKDFKTVS